ncbi:MAG: PPC domain-containing protein [Caldilineaceae bacterium]
MKARIYVSFVVLLILVFFAQRSALAQATTPITDTTSSTDGSSVEIEFYVIGFGVDDATTQQLKEIAAVTDGVYFDARSQQDLEAALSQGVGAGNALPVDAETEPNNSFGKATTIDAGSTIQGAIAIPGDNDWYAFDVKNQGELQLTISNVATDLAIDVRVWNGNKDTISDWMRPLAKGGETHGVVDLPQAGRYYLEIVEDSGAAASDQSYSLQTIFSPTVESDEPNNTFGSASDLVFEVPLQANILPSGDADWYHVVVDHQGEMQVTINQVPADLAIDFRVWNASKEVVSDWIRPLAKGGDTVGIIDLPAPGGYYLEVIEDSGGGRSIQPYTIQASFVPTADAYEPNNKPGEAAEVPMDVSQQINVLPRGDADWFTFEVDWQGQLDVAITDVPEDLAIDFRVWNANLDVISDWLHPLAKGGDNINFVDLPTAGRYYVEIIEDSGGARSVQPYSLTLAFTRAVDSFEENNNFGQASNLGINRTVQTNILPRGDSDWHYLDVTHQGELQISVRDVPENLAIDVRVWNDNKDTISDWLRPLAKGGEITGVVDLPEPGRYYLEVVEESGSERSIQPFTVETQFTASADNGEPNGTLESATPVTLDTTIPANILPANDADWCRIEITTTGELHVLITNVAPELKLAMRLWNDQKQVVSDWVYPLEGGGDTQATFTIDTSGLYYLEVVDNNGARSIQPYLLRFSMSEIDSTTLSFTQVVTDTSTATATSATTTTITTVITVISSTVTAGGTLTATNVITTTDVVTGSEMITPTSQPSGSLPDMVMSNSSRSIRELSTAPLVAGIVVPILGSIGSSRLWLKRRASRRS